jgi:hypothetical protein
MLFHHFLKLCCLALLVSCQEVPSSQPKPAYPTVVDMLCAKPWKMTKYINVGWQKYDSLIFSPQRDSAAITFRKDHSFSFYTVPRWNVSKNSNIIEGRWEFQDINEEKQVCDGVNEQCTNGYYYIILHTDKIALNADSISPIANFFNTKDLSIGHFNPKDFSLIYEWQSPFYSSSPLVIDFKIID